MKKLICLMLCLWAGEAGAVDFVVKSTADDPIDVHPGKELIRIPAHATVNIGPLLGDADAIVAISQLGPYFRTGKLVTSPASDSAGSAVNQLALVLRPTRTSRPLHFYVGSDTTTGASDTNTCTTPSAPCATFYGMIARTPLGLCHPVIHDALAGTHTTSLGTKGPAAFVSYSSFYIDPACAAMQTQSSDPTFGPRLVVKGSLGVHTGTDTTYATASFAADTSGKAGNIGGIFTKSGGTNFPTSGTGLKGLLLRVTGGTGYYDSTYTGGGSWASGQEADPNTYMIWDNTATTVKIINSFGAVYDSTTTFQIVDPTAVITPPSGAFGYVFEVGGFHGTMDPDFSGRQGFFFLNLKYVSTYYQTLLGVKGAYPVALSFVETDMTTNGGTVIDVNEGNATIADVSIIAGSGSFLSTNGDGHLWGYELFYNGSGEVFAVNGPLTGGIVYSYFTSSGGRCSSVRHGQWSLGNVEMGSCDRLSEVGQQGFMDLCAVTGTGGTQGWDCIENGNILFRSGGDCTVTAAGSGGQYVKAPDAGWISKATFNGVYMLGVTGGQYTSH